MGDYLYKLLSSDEVAADSLRLCYVAAILAFLLFAAIKLYHDPLAFSLTEAATAIGGLMVAGGTAVRIRGDRPSADTLTR